MRFFNLGILESLLKQLIHTCLWYRPLNLTKFLFSVDILYRCYLLYSTRRPTLHGSPLPKLCKYVPLQAHTTTVCAMSIYYIIVSTENHAPVRGTLLSPWPSKLWQGLLSHPLWISPWRADPPPCSPIWPLKGWSIRFTANQPSQGW